jgi:hypothetical protein
MGNVEVEKIKHLLSKLIPLVNDLTKEEQDEIDQYLDEQGWPDQENSRPARRSQFMGTLAALPEPSTLPPEVPGV